MSTVLMPHEFGKLLDEYALEKEAIRFHEFAEEMGADEEDCCDEDIGVHVVRASELRAQLVEAYDALAIAEIVRRRVPNDG